MFQEIQTALGRGEAVALLTVVRVNGAAPCGPGTKLLVRADGSTHGTFGGVATDARAREAGLTAMASGQPDLLVYHLDPELGESVGSCGATLEIFVEPLQPEPRLLVVGSGYVAQALARLTAPLGWRVTLLDDRSEFTQAGTLASGAEMALGDLPGLVTAHHPDVVTAVVIVTRGHRSDTDALRAALGTGAGYVGMIGSPSKVRNIFRTLLREGYPAEELERVYAPIGLDIHAQTPDEIALSIAAELLMWRRGGSGGPLRDQQRILAQVRTEQTEQAASGADEVNTADEAPEAPEAHERATPEGTPASS